MANTFKSIGTKLTTNTIYIVGSGVTAVVKSLYISNIDASSSSAIDVCIRKSGAGSDVYLIKEAVVPIQSSLQVITESLVLEDGDILKVKALDSDRLDTILSYLEMS